MSILQIGKVYEVMRPHGQYSWKLGKARADIVNGQEVLVGAYNWKTKRPESFVPIHRIGLTGKIFTDDELKGTGFGKLFGPRKRIKHKPPTGDPQPDIASDPDKMISG